MKENIIINEVGLRECFQNLKKLYRIEDKLQLLDYLILSGLKHIQLCSFVSPKILPQMADAEDLYSSAPDIDNVKYSAFILNVKGFHRAVNCGFKRLETSISLDDDYEFINTGKNERSALNELKKISDLANKFNIQLRIGLQCAWGRKNKKINYQILSDKIDKIVAMNPYKICLADTAGVARPETINECLRIVYPLIKNIPLVMHFHQTNERWQDNVITAIKIGVREFDSAVGGEGGSPFLIKSKGNIPTEELVKLIDERGFNSGVDLSIIDKSALKLNRIVNKIPTSTINLFNQMKESLK